MKNHKRYFLYCLCIFISCFSVAQKYLIEIPKDKIPKNHAFEIKVISNGQRILSCSDFPEISGFEKRNTSSSSVRQIYNGNMNLVSTYSQVYVPQKQGTFKLSPFEMTVNGQKIKSNGIKITVTEPIQKQRQRSLDIFDDPFSDPFFSRKKQKPIQFKDVDDHAFFTITPSKTEVYAGEGITLNAAMYISQKDLD